jgi:hypothetical protein
MWIIGCICFFYGRIRLLYSHFQMASKCHFISCTWETGVNPKKNKNLLEIYSSVCISKHKLALYVLELSL